MKKNELLGAIVSKGKNQQEMAKILGITPKTFSTKLNSGNFTLNQAATMIKVLDIKDPVSIFFAK